MDLFRPANVSARLRRHPLALASAACALGLALGGIAVAHPAPGAGGCGHDFHLDDVDALLEKAGVLMTIIENPGVVPPFGNHDVKAQRAIERARVEVAKAIAFAENSCN